MEDREEFAKYGLYDSRFEHDGCGVGFVCNIKGERTNDIVLHGLGVLKRLSHRGATGADPGTGDGAGVLIQIPHKFFKKVCEDINIDLPSEGEYGTGLVFLPKDTEERIFSKNVFSQVVKEEGLEISGWRSVPTDDSCIGKIARDTRPVIEQVFIKKVKGSSFAASVKMWGLASGDKDRLKVKGKDEDGIDFERRFYIIRKKIENAIRASSLKQKASFYITNLSSRTFSYKGLLMPHQVENFFTDLKDTDVTSGLALVHSRYSTNTFPTWDLAQPFRFLAHNGEINTLRGNINWMAAREGLLESKIFGEDLKKIFPIVVPGGSDSASIDNVFELLVLSGRDLAHAMMMLIPSAWQQDRSLGRRLRDFYKYHACLVEPWDGPAAIAFTDGKNVAGVLDRNGLRPARYIITKKGLVVMASEVGVLDVPQEEIFVSGRIKPGKIFFVDTQQGRIIDDAELKEKMASRQPYSDWLKKNMVELSSLLRRPECSVLSGPCFGTPCNDILTSLKVFGYTREDLKMIIKPMAESAQEPVGSMGNDTPHAVLSQQPQLLYNYFKQLFAQVTNPAMDPIREELVMSLQTYLGPEKNILEESPHHCYKLMIKNPILTNEELAKIINISKSGFKTKVISILFKLSDENAFSKTLDNICKEAEAAIKEGFTFVVLSDHGANRGYAAIPALLAMGAVHHYLIKKTLRTQIGIIVESAEPREVHHFALLFGYGADCINPYLAYEAVKYIIDEDVEADGHSPLQDFKTAQENYIKAVEKGILKILSKMGISTLQSYRGAQIFEALGLNEEVINRCFSGTVSRIGGAGLNIIAEETILRHKQAYPDIGIAVPYLATGGLYQWKKDAEFHLWNPESIARLQDAARNADYTRYKEFAELINNQSKNPTTLRSLFKFEEAKPIPLDSVEPVSEIVKRFATGAMSFGSISGIVHKAIAIAMNRLKGKSNTGEGGEDPSRFKVLENGDSCRSAIKQIASGRFGVTTNYLVNSDEIQIKIAQGAKPGEGGQLPGHKVSVTIARTRYTTPGVTLISPPPHHDIYSIEDLAQLIFDLKNTNPNARISVKLVSEVGVGTVAAGVAKGHADIILISGGDGGTGASPLSSIKHAGLPWELGLAETHQTLVLNGLRGRARLAADGQMRTGRDVAIAAMLGAEEFGFCTAPLIVLGCVMLRHCHLNNCSVGVATQDEILENRFQGKPEFLINYFKFVAEELREIMASLGIRSLDELIGRTDLLEVNGKILPWKAKKLDLSRILYRSGQVPTRQLFSEESVPTDILDYKLIELAKDALENKTPIRINLEIKNINRTTGAMLSGQVCKLFGEEGLPGGTIHCKFKGIAGQSFGAWLMKGITFELEGMANDYVGKGISGGEVIIYPDKKADYKSQENIIIGNTTFYGAISGSAYIRGVAGERFCIRNSGLSAVVEGTGDHGCEYMTGGMVVVLGRTGRNFAAGMSGGIAYIYDEAGDFKSKCNMDMVALEKLSDEDLRALKRLISEHYECTQSPVAKNILDDFKNQAYRFVRVMPLEYRRILEGKKQKPPELAEVSDG